MAEGGVRAVVDRFLVAANRHDIEATLACLSEDFVCRGPDGFCLSRDQMRVWLGWEAVMSYAYEIHQVQDLDDTLTAVMTEQSELYQLLQMEPQHVRLRFEVKGGLIRVQEFELLPGTRGLDAALRPFLDWVDRERPAALTGFREGDTPVFGKQSAERWLPLLREWRASSAGPVGSAG